jgi:hypothetical protein
LEIEPDPNVRAGLATSKGAKMGYDFMGKGGYFGCNAYQWEMLLPLAVKYGWEHEYPLGEYLGNDFQSVSDVDAMALATAIERAAIGADNVDDEYREYLLKFAEFCRAGGFRIG